MPQTPGHPNGAVLPAETPSGASHLGNAAQQILQQQVSLLKT